MLAYSVVAFPLGHTLLFSLDPLNTLGQVCFQGHWVRQHSAPWGGKSWDHVFLFVMQGREDLGAWSS